jgi:hypothetical protein
MKVSKYAKAVVGAVAAGATALGTALVDNSISGQEWVTVAAAVLATFGLTWAVPNKE